MIFPNTYKNLVTGTLKKALELNDNDSGTYWEEIVSGSLTEVTGQGHTFFRKGVPNNQPSIHGVSFTIRNRIARVLPERLMGQFDRLMTLKIPQEKLNHMSLKSVWLPIVFASEKAEGDFYNRLTSDLRVVNPHDKLVSKKNSMLGLISVCV